MKDDGPLLITLGILAALLFMTEVVSCQWHADNLTHGCASNPVACIRDK